MTNETTKKEEVNEKPDPKGPALVTSIATIDWPEFGWGIHAGETRELPADEKARAIILSSDFIKSVKN